MSKIWVECWQCDECGHVWIKSWDGKTPEQCASSKCRKRSWNKDQVFVPADPTNEADVAAAQEASRMARNLSKPDMATGRLTRAETMFSDTIVPYKAPYETAEAPICMACEGSMVEGQGKSAGRWACRDVSCPRYGIEVKR